MDNDVLTLLYRYQETRRRCLTLKAEVAGLDSASSRGRLNERLEKIQKEVASCQEAISLIKRRIKAGEDNCFDLANHQRESESALYGGKIISPKELVNLEQKIKEYKEAQSKGEEQILEDLLAVEAEEEKLQALLKEKNKVQRKLAAEKDRLDQEKSIIGAEMELLRKKLEELEKLLPKELKERFDKMVGKMHGTVIAPVKKDGACGGCHVLLSPAIKEKMGKRGQPVVTCENCGRLIFSESEKPQEF